jgi:hypothetical protein
MYHLFVTSQSDAWESNWYEYEKSRFLEFTREDIAAAYRILTPSHIETLKTYPCLFAYEGSQYPMRIGRLTNIAERGKHWLIEFTFDPTPEIPSVAIKDISALLDIRKWEMNRTHWAIKDEDLLARLRSRNIIPPDALNLPGRVATSTDLPLTAAAPVSINSVGEFIQTVLATGQLGNNAEVFYRGHADRARHKLVPSLFRQDQEGNYLYRDREDLLYRELLVSNFADFADDVYTLDRLVRMQHYSLPTRLLDITSNPLIALYFACKSHKVTEGEVIVFSIVRDNIKYFDSDTASCIANLARLPQAEKDAIDLASPTLNVDLPIQRLLHFIREEKSFFESRIVPDDLQSVLCVKSKKTNSRISSQAGAFLLFGLDAVLGEAGDESIRISRVAVQNKVAILNELDHLNINESTVFPYIENSAKYIAKKYAFRADEPPLNNAPGA